MIKPALPVDETSRLQTLKSLGVLDTAPEERFDRLTRIAKRLFGVPVALISLVDENRQWFKSCQGLSVGETPRDVSFCGHAILGDDIMIVSDAAADERFHDNPLVVGEPKIRFYAGAPLIMPDGSKLGTLCVIDHTPRQVSAEELNTLRDLAQMAAQEIAAVNLAVTDELTLLTNRRGFQMLGQHALDLCDRLGSPAVVLFFDLDGFKQINDRFGHAEGDRALRKFASMLTNTFRDSDLVCRLGGDEFVVLMTNASCDEVKIALKRLQLVLDQYNRISGSGYELRFSVGQVAHAIGKSHAIDVLLAEADASMYGRKRTKRIA